jgi:asparagine synthase (glutamine-hydrolysing)
MCGVFGVASPDGVDLSAARKSLKTLTHRGPDQEGEFEMMGVYMGHTRLSILDLSDSARQPMISRCKTVAICVNGEIYNFQELRRELEQQNAEFKSGSDSEVVLHGYMAWGIDGLLERIDGMYAIAICDFAKQKIYLVRDRYGVKPLYYFHSDKLFSWGSELKAVEAYVRSCRHLHVDETALYDFLTYSYIPPPKTLYRSCYKLAAAHYLVYDLKSGSATTCRYWDLPERTCGDSFERASLVVREKLIESIRKQLVADVPVGCLLSGGVDSSVITATASGMIHDIKSFSLAFSVKEHDESHYASLVAKQFGTDHFRDVYTEDSAELALSKLKNWFDEPFSDYSYMPTYQVCKNIKKHCTVALSGDGGDEIFAGYSWYEKFKTLAGASKIRGALLVKMIGYLKKSRTKLGSAFYHLEANYVLEGIELYVRLMGGMIKNEKNEFRELWGIDSNYDDYWFFRQYYDERLPMPARMQVLDFKTFLPEAILTKVDRVSMRNSLECRVPFLDRALVEYVFSLQPHVFDRPELKALLKEAFRDVLPEEIISRPKKGFGLPLRHWGGLVHPYRFKQEKVLSLFGLI